MISFELFVQKITGLYMILWGLKVRSFVRNKKSIEGIIFNGLRNLDTHLPKQAINAVPVHAYACDTTS